MNSWYPHPVLPADMAVDLEATAQHFREQGVNHSIPECCIDQFVEDICTRGISPRRRAVDSLPYIPCGDCLQKVAA